MTHLIINIYKGSSMSLEKHMFRFFIILGMKLNFAIFLVDINDPSHRDGDRIVFCVIAYAKAIKHLLLNNIKVITYVGDAIEVPESVVWRKFKKKFA